MFKRKKCRKFLNVFLCVLSIVAVFSVTVFAADKVYASDVTIHAGDEIYNFEYSEGAYYHYITFSQGYIGFRTVYSDTTIADDYVTYVVDYEYFHDLNSGKKFYPGDSVAITQAATVSYDLYAVSSIDSVSVFMTMDFVVGVVTDFADLISENALLFLFVIGLPICSFGVGLLIRIKERT